MNIHLQHPLPPVGWPGEPPTYGGTQRILSSPGLRRCGCGVVAGLDLVRYFHLYHPGMESDFFRGAYVEPCMSPIFYDSCARRMSQRFLPVIPPIGTNGPALAAGLTGYCRAYGIPVSLYWGVRTNQFWTEAARMLGEDLPVIFSIGRPFPKLWSGDKVDLWRNGTIACRVDAHFLTMTGLDDIWCYVSSWGRNYAIRRSDFDHYRRRCSNGLLCNLLSIRSKD